MSRHDPRLSDAPRTADAPAAHRNRRRAFTLIELVVAIGLLVGVLAMVGTIFGLAGQTASLGTATVDVYREIRMAAEILERDLQGFDPAEGALAIAGGVTWAYATPEDRDSGRSLSTAREQDFYRVDTLMFFTTTRARPFAFVPADPNADLPYATQVVYQHADFGEIDPIGRWNPAAFRRIVLFDGVNASPIPASDFHLARRALPLYLLPPLADTRVTSGLWLYPPFGVGSLMGGNESLSLVLTCGGENRLPGYDAVANFDLQRQLDLIGSNIPDDWYLRRTIAGTPIERVILDPSPPAAQHRRLAYFFAPGCTDFKVEVTFDRPARLGSTGMQGLFAGRSVRWWALPSGTHAEWIRANPATTTEFPPQWAQRFPLENPPIPFPPPFPSAIKITLRFWDPNTSLPQPVEHVLIHAF